MPRTLVIDTATAACSVALIEDGVVVAEGHDVVGRGHAERLMPMIRALPGGGRADQILVDCGPGSFTGVRVGLAAARALGLGWGIPVSGYSSMALLAAAAPVDADNIGSDAVGVALIGGHGELFVQRFARAPFASLSPLASLPPALAAAAIPDVDVVGSAAAALVEARGHGRAIEQLPRAADAVRLEPAFAALPPRPIYGRDADATPAAA